MSFKINRNKLESYSQALTEKISNEFFESKVRIKGEEILSLTDIPQVNVFILFNLFEKWKEESLKLRSPYFDYEAKEVSDALNKFQNILSKNISIEKEFFKPLLQKSILETLTWVFFPEDYIQVQFNLGRLNALSKLKEYQKYIRINSILITELIAKLERERKYEFSEEELLFYFSQVHLFQKTFMEDPATILDQFSLILSFDINELLPASQRKRKETPAPEIVVPPVIENETIQPEFEEENPKIMIQEIKLDEPEEEKVVQQVVPEPAMVVSEPKILNQGFSKSQLTLNDRLMQSDNSLNKKLAKSRLNDVRSAISLNKRFEFINELFKGETTEYNLALSEIENSKTYDAAIKAINEKYGKKFGWTIGNPALDEFFEIVERRFM